MAESAYAYALQLLNARGYSTSNLRRKLSTKFERAEVDAAIARLEDARLLDDHRFAVEFTRSRLMGRGASMRRIRQDLARRGIERSIADTAVEETLADEEIDLDSVLERVAMKKLKTLGDLDPMVSRRRLMGFLLRQGYDLDRVKQVVARLLASK